MFNNASTSTRRRTTAWPAIALALLALLSGCRYGPSIVAENQRRIIDRAVVEYPPGYDLRVLARGLTGPSCIAFDYDDPVHKGSMFVAESGQGDNHVRIYYF